MSKIEEDRDIRNVFRKQGTIEESNLACNHKDVARHHDTVTSARDAGVKLVIVSPSTSIVAAECFDLLARNPAVDDHDVDALPTCALLGEVVCSDELVRSSAISEQSILRGPGTPVVRRIEWQICYETQEN